MPDPNNFILPGCDVIFIGIPKTGQTSVKSAFVPAAPNPHAVQCFKHLPYYDVKRYQTAGFKVATIVRNPYDKLYSFWKSKILVPNKLVKTMNKRFRRPPFYTGMSFEACVNSVLYIPDSKANLHFRSMHAQTHYNGEFLPDFVGRFEELEKSWELLEELSGIKFPPLPWKNRSQEKDENCLDFYTPDMIDSVNKRYSLDFEVFGYDKL